MMKPRKAYDGREHGRITLRQRNITIKKLWDNGADQRWIAAKYNLTPARICQIIAQETRNESMGFR